MSAIRSSVGSAYNDCKLHFYTSKNKAHATEKMIITGNGNVGIGTTIRVLLILLEMQLLTNKMFFIIYLKR